MWEWNNSILFHTGYLVFCKTQKICIFDEKLILMLTTIEGIYENGQVIFNKIPPIQKKTKIFGSASNVMFYYFCLKSIKYGMSSLS